jgi:AAHS family benzoate transporter-like MFS transporter
MGFVSACGRLGAIVGAIVGGALIALRLPLHVIFMVMAAPAVVAAAALTLLRPAQPVLKILSTEPCDA